MKKLLKTAYLLSAIVMCLSFGGCTQGLSELSELSSSDSSASSDSSSELSSSSDDKSSDEIKEDEEDKKEDKNEEKKEDKEYNVGDTVTINDIEFTLNSVEVTDKIENGDYMYFAPDEDGSQYIVINATVKNIASDSKEFLPIISTRKDISVKIQYKDYELNASNLMGHSDQLCSTVLNPLSSKTGIIAFEAASEFTDAIDECKFVLSADDESYSFSLNQ